MTTPSLPNAQSYFEQVWVLVRQVPPGRVVTYGQIAQQIHPPTGVDEQTYKAFAPRWVGDAMAACPADVPWQRVINAQGKISDRRGAARQRFMLEAEGVVFVKDKVDLKVFGWHWGEAGFPKQAVLF
ncbi:MAG: MGMT family protein [Anaerolineales bacterium]|nr:MGMT family protein [Anaerolineales bacterium]